MPILSSYITLFFELSFALAFHFFLLLLCVLLVPPLIYFREIQDRHRSFLFLWELDRIQTFEQPCRLQIHVFQVEPIQKFFLSLLQEFDVFYNFPVFSLEFLDLLLKRGFLFQLAVLIFLEKNSGFLEFQLGRFVLFLFFQVVAFESLDLILKLQFVIFELRNDHSFSRILGYFFELIPEQKEQRTVLWMRLRQFFQHGQKARNLLLRLIDRRCRLITYTRSLLTALSISHYISEPSSQIHLDLMIRLI